MSDSTSRATHGPVDDSWESYQAQRRADAVTDFVAQMGAAGTEPVPVLAGAALLERAGAPVLGWPVEEAARDGSPGLVLTEHGELFPTVGTGWSVRCEAHPQPLEPDPDLLEDTLLEACRRWAFGLVRPAAAGFSCRGCGAMLTDAGLREVPYEALLLGPAPRVQPAPLTEPGTFAIDPEPFGPGRSRPTVVLHPRAAVGAQGDPGRRESWCCGPTGASGPNLVCRGCAAPVGTLVAECYLTHTFVRLEPDRVRIEAAGERPGTGA